jgi:hypothetical protein
VPDDSLVKSLESKMRFYLLAGVAVGGLSLLGAAVYFKSRSHKDSKAEPVWNSPQKPVQESLVGVF